MPIRDILTRQLGRLTGIESIQKNDRIVGIINPLQRNAAIEVRKLTSTRRDIVITTATDIVKSKLEIQIC